MIVVRMVTASSTNMTGLVASVRGSSLTKAEPIAGQTIFGSRRAVTGFALRSVEAAMEGDSEEALEKDAGIAREMFDKRAERERREEGQPADDEDHADDQADEKAAGGRERP